MIDAFDLQLLEELQREDGRTAEKLSRHVALSPSAIARRLRRLRAQGWVDRSIALLSAKLTRDRLRAIVMIELDDHANQTAKKALRARLDRSVNVQFAYEITGEIDIIALVDCRNMADFNALTETLLEGDQMVRRFVTNFVKHEIKFAPFVALGGEV